MGQAYNAGHQTRRDIGVTECLAVLGRDLDGIALGDAAVGGVLLRQIYRVVHRFTKPGDVVEDGVGTSLIMRVDALKRELRLLAVQLAVHEGVFVALGGSTVLRDCAVRLVGEALGVQDIRPGLVGELDLAGVGADGIGLGILAEFLLVDIAEVVPDVAVDAVNAVLHVLADGDAAFLRLALDAPFLDVVLGDGDQVFPGLAVFLNDGGGGDGVEEQLLGAYGAPHLGVEAELLADGHHRLGIALGLIEGLDHLAVDEQDVAVDVAFPDIGAFALPVGGDGQDDVGVLVGSGEEVALGYNKLDGAESLDAFLGTLAGRKLCLVGCPDHLDRRGDVINPLCQIIAGNRVLPAVGSGAVDVVEDVGRVEGLAEDRVPDLGVADHGRLAGTAGGAVRSGGADLDQARAEVVGVVPGGGADAVAALADVAAHGPQAGRQLRELVGVIGAGAGPGGENRDIVVLAENPGDLPKRVGRDPGDGFRPFGCLGHAVVLAPQIVEEVLIRLHIRGHVILVLTQAAAIQEVPVNERTVLVLFQHHIGHRHHRGHIGARPDGDPLRVKNGSAVGVDRVEDDELDPGLLPLDGIVGGVAQGRPGRIVAESHHIVAVQEIQTVVVAVIVVAAVAPADRAGCIPGSPGACGPGVHIVDVQLVQQAVRLTAQGENGVVAVGAVDALHLVMDVGGRFVPGDALPLVDASQFRMRVAGCPVLALHGILQAVQASGLILLGIASEAGSLLAVHLIIGVEVVGALTDNHAVLHIGTDQALAAAVMPARSRDPLAALRRIGHDRPL